MSDASKLLEILDARPESWRKEMLSLYDQGASDREVMRELDLLPDQWKVLCADLTSDFLKIVETGRLLQHAWWETQGRKNLYNNKFNTQLYKFQMSNRFGWSDRTESSMTNIDFSNADDQTLMREIEELSARMSKRSKTDV